MTDKEMPAIEVFAVAIGYMKKHFLEMLHGKYEKKLIHTEDIHFILTVPAIWSDLSKQFMRKAAVRVKRYARYMCTYTVITKQCFYHSFILFIYSFD